LIKKFQPTDETKRQLFVVQSAGQPPVAVFVAQEDDEQVAAPSAEKDSSRVWEIATFILSTNSNFKN